jgi:glutathione S-transferase
MIKVHHLSDSRSQRILWLLEELGLPYEIKRYERNRRTMLAPPELRRVHPLGKAPIVEDEGIVLVETGAIVEHLVRKGGRFGPPDDLPGTLLWRQFLHYAEGSLMPPLLGMFAQHLGYLESELQARDWFAGAEITAADIMLSFPLEAARGRAGLDERYPKLQAWLQRIQARPAYRAALAKGGPYAYA